MRVLLVEDEPLIAMIMEDLLADLGCEVVGPFGAVAPAMDWLGAGGAIDGALLDVNLGGERVFPVALALRQKGVPFAFATGYGEIEDERFSTETVLSKPLDPGKLAVVVQRFAAA